MSFEVNELDLNLSEYNLDNIFVMKPLEGPTGKIFDLKSKTFEEIILKLLDIISNNEIETIERFNSNQMDMFYCKAISIKELLDFLVSMESSILYKNKLIIIKNPDDTLKLYRII